MGIWVHAPGTGWSGTDLLRTNVVCGLWRHLDSVPPDTLIREIVDRCRVWECHSEQKRRSSPATDMYRGHTGVASDSRESMLAMEDSLWVEPQIPVSVASVVQSDLVGAQEVGNVRNRDVSPR